MPLGFEMKRTDLIVHLQIHVLLWKITFLACWAIKPKNGRNVLGNESALILS